MLLKTDIDIVVIGGGQAGLTMGYHLNKLQYAYQILEINQRVGDSWRFRYDSLKLFSPREFSALPGLPVSGDPNGFATKNEIADYLESYAKHFALPVVLGTKVRKLERTKDGFRSTTGNGEAILSREIIIASGAFEKPSIPAISKQLDPRVQQFSPATYRNPEQITPGMVLVVGDGATGRQIALELSSTHRVILAHGRKRSVSPNFIFGKNNFWWMELLGLSRLSKKSLIGKYFMKLDPFPGLNLSLFNLRRRGIRVVHRLTGIDGNRVTFAKGITLEVSSVIWATGYRDDTSWVNIPEIIDEHGNFIQERGLTSVKNLFLIGKNWQWTRGSALLFGVTRDAEYLLPFINKGLN
jgi:putative flavoprotein involved in K+ transport